jgi:hypothetical protein
VSVVAFGADWRASAETLAEARRLL